MIVKYVFLGCIVALMSLNTAYAQSVGKVSELDEKYIDWHNKDLSVDQIMGVSTNKAYEELLKGKKPSKTIVVAVIDGGVDVEHEDLKGKIWINKDEIPGNGIDDDGNGYVDDIHGWNFIGNEKGENVNQENLEFVRILNEGSSHPDYARALKYYNKEHEKHIKLKADLDKFTEIWQKCKDVLYDKTRVRVNSLEDLEKIKEITEEIKPYYDFMKSRLENGFDDKELKSILEYNSNYLDYMLNREMDFRSLVGDDPKDITDTQYGNNDVTGPRGSHGTMVAGIIAAVRNNGLGVDGIADNVKIMAIRSTPDGDERDKDVALAIRYAVDNGAHIINMSFGKDFSPQKQFVDEAVKYANEKGVLLIHAAGNDSKNLEKNYNFPTDTYNDGGVASNWIEVGANDINKDEHLVASFSNYGKNKVDVFAPGVNIVSLDTVNTYSMNDGTSFAGPVVAGMAALLWSYYPELTASQLKEVILNTSYKVSDPVKVVRPSEKSKEKQVKFSTMSLTGGVVNVYEALKYLENNR